MIRLCIQHNTGCALFTTSKTNKNCVIVVFDVVSWKCLIWCSLYLNVLKHNCLIKIVELEFNFTYYINVYLLIVCSCVHVHVVKSHKYM